MVQPSKLDGLCFEIVGDVAGLGIVIARLAHTAGVHEVFFARLNSEFGKCSATNDRIPDKSDWDMRVPEKAGRRYLINETRLSRELVENVAPPFRLIQHRMNNCEPIEYPNER